MKKRNFLVTIAAIIMMLAFVSCSENVTLEDKLGTIIFGEENSRAVGTVVKYSNEVEDMIWFYQATKLDDGYTTGKTDGFVAVAEATKVDGQTTYTATPGLSGKTLNSTGFSYGLWNIVLEGYKKDNVTVSSDGKNVTINTGATAEYTANINNFLVNKTANYATAKIELVEGAETKIVFDSISFSSDNIKADSTFTLSVKDNKGTVTVSTGSGDVVVETGKVTFNKLTYELNANQVITGDHEMEFVLSQTLKSTTSAQSTTIEAALYTLKFTVQEGTTTTISGTLLKNDETGTIQINSVQDVPQLTLSKVMPVEIAEGTTDVATVLQETKINYGDLEVVYPAGTVISTEEGSVENKTSDAKIGFEYKQNSTTTGIKIAASEATMTFELSLSASTSDETGKKNEQLITIKKFIGKGLTISTIYHATEPLAAEISETVPSDGKEGYYYNAETGYLTLYVLHASEFNIVTKEAVATVGNEKYYSLKSAIETAAENATVTLLSNVTVDEAIAVSKNITLDLKNKVVTVEENVNITLSDDKVVTVQNSTASQAAFINAVEVKSFSGAERSYHTTLESALSAVKEGGTVTLWDNVNLSKDVEVSVSFKLDLNNKTVTASDGKQVIVKAGTMTVTGKTNGQAEFVCGVKNGDNYTVATAKTGDTYYSSLKTAIEAAEEGSTVTLLRDTTLTETATVSKSITLDLNNKVVTVSGDANVVVDAGTLTVTNKVEGQTEFVFGMKGDGDTYTAVIVSIDGSYFSTLTAAIQAASDGATITFCKDTSLDEMCTIQKNLTIDLNNCTLTIGDSSPFMSVGTYDGNVSYEVAIKNGKLVTNRTNLDSNGFPCVFSAQLGCTLILDNVEVIDSTVKGLLFNAFALSNYQGNGDYSTTFIVKDSKITLKGKEANAVRAFNCQKGNKPINFTVINSTIDTSDSESIAVAVGGYDGPVELNIINSTLRSECIVLELAGNITAKITDSIIESTQKEKKTSADEVNAPIVVCAHSGENNLGLTNLVFKYTDGTMDGHVYAVEEASYHTKISGTLSGGQKVNITIESGATEPKYISFNEEV